MAGCGPSARLLWELIVHGHEVKPLGRRDHATAASIARIAHGNKIIDAPAARPHKFERARNRAHLRVQKRFRACLDVDFLTGPYDIEPVQRAYWACRLAFSGAKGRKIVPA